MADSTYMRLALKDSAESGHHAGLKLQHGLTQNDDKGKNAHRTNVAGTTISGARERNAYGIAYSRFSKLMAKPGVIRIEGELLGPLAASLGVASPTENGLALLHTYGVPTIPASSIKGAFRRAIQTDSTSLTPEQKEFLVGSDRTVATGTGERKAGAGRLVFHDAWYDPSSVSGKPLQPDIMTPHHTGYYQTQGKKAPADFEDPIPVGFVSVRRGTRFVFYVECPTTDPAWLDFVRAALSYTLTEVGLGAKTNAGYGYFKVIV
jgi:CRISPR-associated protein Cmr6